jgi:hypothetical protein
MGFLSDYVSYFEFLCICHQSIKHAASAKHFFRMELDELLNGLPSKAKFPVFILEAYDVSFFSRDSNNIMKNFNGAFTILDKPDNQQDYDSIEDVWDACEEIGTDFIVMMYNHRLKQTTADTFDPDGFIKNFDVNNVEAMPVATDVDGTFGFRFTFTLTAKIDHRVDDEKWAEPK